MELKGHLKELHLEQQPAASSQQPAASSQQPAASSQQREVMWEGGIRTSARGPHPIKGNCEKKSKGNPIGHLLELKGNLKELHLEQQPAASSRQQAASSQQPAASSQHSTRSQ